MKKLLIALILFVSISANAQTEAMRLNLYHGDTLVDGIYMEYNNAYHKEVLIEDAPKMHNINENLFVDRDNRALAVERRPLLISNDTTWIALTKVGRTYYNMQFIPNNLNNHPGMKATIGFDFFVADVSLTDTSNIRLKINPLYYDEKDTTWLWLIYTFPDVQKPAITPTTYLTAYPNPVTCNTFSVGVPLAGSYYFQIFNDSGVLVHTCTQNIITNGGAAILKINLPRGYYYIRVTMPNKETRLLCILKS